MGKRVFDITKMTLTDFSPESYEAAMMGELAARELGAGSARPAVDVTAHDEDVPKGRTTLSLQRVGNAIRPNSAGVEYFRPSPASPNNTPNTVGTRRAVSAPAPMTTADDVGALRATPATYAPAATTAPPPDTQTDWATPAAPQTVPNQTTAQTPDALPDWMTELAPELAPTPTPARAPADRSETAVALHVLATPAPPKIKKTVNPDDKVPMNLRIEQKLKDEFYKKCEDRGVVASIVLRNLIREYCRTLCLVFCLLTLAFPSRAAADDAAGALRTTPAPANAGNTGYTTAQILTYLQGKAFGGLMKNAPAARGTIGARHALWQTGAADPVNDFVYSDYSNTRLEAKIEIPIFDLSYLRNRDREKLEHKAFIMKSLSRILAAQKTIYVLENRIGTVRARKDYVGTQINLKLANRSDQFTIEDNIYTLQAQLYEAQSTLEQRVIELAVLAEEDWLDAYAMIIKWDGVLFDKADKVSKRK